MSHNSMKGLVEWARRVDRGINELENRVKGTFILPRNGDDLAQVKARVSEDVVVPQELKVSLQEDTLKLKNQSVEFRTLIATVKPELAKLHEELLSMHNALFPTEVISDESTTESFDGSSQNSSMMGEPANPTMSLPTIKVTSEEESQVHADTSANNASPGTSALSEESYTAVEVTPGLNYKVPKSSLGEQDNIFLASSVTPLFKRIRRRVGGPLIFSPAEGESSSQNGQEPKESHTENPNLEGHRSGALPSTSNTSDLGKPKPPVLSVQSYYKLIGIEQPNDLYTAETPRP